MSKSSEWQLRRATRMADEFRAALAGLGSITNATPLTYEGADYQRLLLQPADGLASALVTTREIIVLACPFTDVQTRSIRLAENELERLSGRVEPGMVVVLHDDVDGSGTLREWGREQGITVLLVLASPRIPRAEDLEAALCSGLYAHDPFDLAGPVRAAHQFYGRSEVPDLARRLRTGDIHSIFGMRKIGKTSVLNRVLAEAAEYHQMSCAFLDCSSDAVSKLNASGLLQSITTTVAAVLEGNAPHEQVSPIHAANAHSLDTAARALLTSLTSSPRPLLLAFDEVDYISPSSPTAPHWVQEFNSFFRALRWVYQECSRRGVPFPWSWLECLADGSTWSRSTA